MHAIILHSDAIAETYIRITLISINNKSLTKFELGTPISAFVLEPEDIDGICIPFIYRKNYEWFIGAASWNTSANAMTKENGFIYVYFITNTYDQK